VSEFLLYQSEDGRTKLSVVLEDETLWLSQKQLTDLFGKAKGTISEHIKHIFEDGELIENSVVRLFRTTAADGKTYEVAHYNLDMVLAVGYRVRSQVGVRFRQWASAQLKEFIVKGFVLDDERLKNPGKGLDYFDELSRRLQDIRTSERRFYQKITDIYATSVDYDPAAPLTQEFFATVMSLENIVRSVSGRLSLREPQAESLRRLHWAVDQVPALRDSKARSPEELKAMQEALTGQFPTLADFERDFPSLCFALATGVGKTRLMGAFISYLHAAYGYKHFFVLAPNLTIYDKLIGDFSPNSPKYVFKGIAEFASTPPEVITGDNYEQRGSLSLLGGIEVNIFNISKINSEVRGGKSPKIKRLSEYLGQSYFEYLAGLDDLVLIMDESHRYRASAGIRSLNELRPLLGLELTATPFRRGHWRQDDAVQERGDGLPAGACHRGWFRQGTGGCHATELRPERP
jgi:biotin operon repressor